MFYRMSPAFGWDYPPIIPLHRKETKRNKIQQFPEKRKRKQAKEQENG